MNKRGSEIMKKLLVVVDMQNDFVTGALGSKEAQEILPAVNQKIADAKWVLYTLDTHTENYLSTQEGRNLPVVHCIRGTWGHALADGLRVADGSVQIEKPSFGSVELGAYVKDAFEKGDIDAVELVGVCTDICVISNALLIKACCPQIPVSVIACCCAGVTPESHENALKAMAACQVKIL